MLKLQQIVKDYQAGDTTVHALRGVSLQFRESEFVAILGHSGCGKTTLLNIIGGLDQYTSGDLVINGKSTKDFSDSDWDSYRNHSIGFVFQSYNLIPHQTVLSNVELALTLSGVSKSERRERAKKALESVGLGDQLDKKPNQMSGGQMQRVAIARALVNDPDILLADEPTGALDSETSVQVMEILKNISKDRLIIMVTHNPELAETYASRIVRLKDGEIVDDTLYDYIAAGYVTGMGDKDARYYTAKQYLEYLNQQNGVVMGVGADVIKDANGYARIVKVYPNSPAEESGLQKNFYITKVGELDVKTLSLSQVNSQLLGESGTSVLLTVVNATGEDEHTVEIQRREFDVPSVEGQVPEGTTTAYFWINAFNSKTVDELKAYFERWQEEGVAVDGVVFDVRNNTGGNLTNAMHVIDYLCPVGPIASQQNKDGTVTTLETSDASEVELPMVVLVNGNTSYAAELFATSIREFEKGRVVGTRTAGKGTIQCRPVALSDGSAFSYTVGLLLSKNGATFNGTGISPDVEASLSAEEEANFYNFTVDTDPQILRAFEVVDTLTGRNDIQASLEPSQSSSASEAGGAGSSLQSEPAGTDASSAAEPAA